MNETKTNTNIEKAQKFMQYIGDNLTLLKKNLKKNVTFDEDIFDDVISESILKIYNTIEKNGTDITDYERYFYIVSKFTYIYRHNKQQRKDELEIRDIISNGKFDLIEDDDESEERFNQTVMVLEAMKKNLTDEFGELKTTIYFDYMYRKSNGNTSYKKMSNDYQLTSKDINEIITEIKKYISTNDSIKKIKRNFNKE